MLGDRPAEPLQLALLLKVSERTLERARPHVPRRAEQKKTTKYEHHVVKGRRGEGKVN